MNEENTTPDYDHYERELEKETASDLKYEAVEESGRIEQEDDMILLTRMIRSSFDQLEFDNQNSFDDFLLKEQQKQIIEFTKRLSGYLKTNQLDLLIKEMTTDL